MDCDQTYNKLEITGAIHLCVKELADMGIISDNESAITNENETIILLKDKFLFGILEILENLKLIEEDCLYLEDEVECGVECKSFHITLFTISFEDLREKNQVTLFKSCFLL